MTARPKSATAGRVVPERQVQADAKRTFVGIDPGKTGAIAWIHPDGTAGARPTPIVEFTNGKWDFDKDEMIALLEATSKYDPGPPFVAIEKVNAAPMRGRKQGAAGMFGFGRGYGLWLGYLSVMAIPFVEVDPRRWKRAILGGTAKDKAAAIGYVQRLYPTVDLKATPRSRKPSDGKADAICIAEYARREWKTRQLLEQRS